MLKRYLRDTTGQFAIMFSVTATVLLLGVGIAVDYAGMTKAKQYLQDITDSAVLAAASSGEDKIGKLKKIATDALNTNNVHGAPLTHTTQLNDDTVRVEAQVAYKTQLLGILGKKTVNLNAVSEALLPKEVPVNLSLVLDTTGSMAGDNMEALQSASKKLIEVFDDDDSDQIQIAVVPYAQWVNVGMANRYKTWMNVPEDSSTTVEKCKMKKDLISKSGCTTTTTTTPYDPYVTYNDGVPTYHPGGVKTKTKETCTTYEYGPEYEHCWMSTNHDKWYGCVGSRNDPHHKDPDYKGKKIPGLMDINKCPNEILRLTTDLDDVEDHIDDLVAKGSTFIPAGLIWGWRMLDPDKPFGDLTNSQTDRKRALVLMTDGKNTVRLKGTWHDSFSDSESNAATWTKESNDLTLELCDGIKAEGIDVYSVAYKFGTGDATAKQMVKDCASNPSMFFDAANAAALETAFEQIGNSLFEVRLSR